MLQVTTAQQRNPLCSHSLRLSYPHFVSHLISSLTVSRPLSPGCLPPPYMILFLSIKLRHVYKINKACSNHSPSILLRVYLHHNIQNCCFYSFPIYAISFFLSSFSPLTFPSPTPHVSFSTPSFCYLTAKRVYHDHMYLCRPGEKKKSYRR